eukprot:TRINITY_DN11568_c0_g1_i1.p2 TRINITY_DN11568_c0_g1~~TRINITY_DN11568_c0_g1_i1.p2  ORF type:complete len:118 (-),score=3.82 TRINITY_DN11568_c0_g1_i1:124-477(-)
MQTGWQPAGWPLHVLSPPLPPLPQPPHGGPTNPAARQPRLKELTVPDTRPTVVAIQRSAPVVEVSHRPHLSPPGGSVHPSPRGQSAPVSRHAVAARRGKGAHPAARGGDAPARRIAR